MHETTELLKRIDEKLKILVDLSLSKIEEKLDLLLKDRVDQTKVAEASTAIRESTEALKDAVTEAT